MIVLSAEQKWKKFKRWLYKRFPLKNKCRIIVKKIPKTNTVLFDIADTVYDPNTERFTIHIGPNSVTRMVDDLMHEFAHVMVWFTGEGEEHGALWAAAFGLIYKEYVAWNYGMAQPIEE